jgi:hypothetical protein
VGLKLGAGAGLVFTLVALVVLVVVVSMGSSDVEVVSIDDNATQLVVQFERPAGKSNLRVQPQVGSEVLSVVNPNDVLGNEPLTLDIRHLPPGNHTLDLVLLWQGGGETLTAEFDVTARLAARDATTLECEGKACRVVYEKDDSFTIVGEPGAKITIAGKTFEASADTERKRVGALRLYEGVAVDKLFDRRPIEVTVHFADGPTLTDKLQPDKQHEGVLRALAQLPSKPVRYEGERDHTGRPRAAAIIRVPQAQIVDTAGAGTGLEVLDAVALFRAKTRSSSCGSYRNQSTGRTTRITRVMTDHEYVVYDRRSGREIGRRTIKASQPTCPKRLAGSAQHSLNATASKSAGKAWVASLLN